MQGTMSAIVTARKSIYYWWNWATHRYHHENLEITRVISIADRASAFVWVSGMSLCRGVCVPGHFVYRILRVVAEIVRRWI